MAQESEIQRLETYLERLLRGYGDLKQEVVQLRQQVEDGRAENERLRGQLNDLDSERGEVHQRVSQLIARIERWEAEASAGELGDSAQSQNRGSAAGGGAAELQADEHSPEQEFDAEEENGSGVQGSLFSGS